MLVPVSVCEVCDDSGGDRQGAGARERRGATGDRCGGGDRQVRRSVLQRLTGRTLRGFDQLGQRLDGLVSRFKRLGALGDAVERRRPRSEDRLFRPEAVKKLAGLSRALLTFLPVARRF